MPRGIHYNKIGSKPFDAHQMPHVSNSDFPKMHIKLVDGRVVPVLQATPQEFDAMIDAIIKRMITPKTKTDLYAKFCSGLDRTKWTKEERWYILDEMAASPLIKKHGIVLFARKEDVA